MNLQGSLKTWEELLSKCITDLKDRYPRLNDGQIADKIDIPRATFNRIKNEQKLPRLDNLIKVVIGSGNSEILSEAISLLDKGLGEAMKQTLSVTLQEENKILANEELETLLDNRDVFVAYLLADMPNGTDKTQLVEVLGNSGLEAIKTLFNKGVVKEENERFFLNKNGTLVRSFDSVKHHLSTYARFYKTEHVGKERNYALSLTDGLSKEGLKKVQDAHRRFHQELQNIYRDETNRGDIPSFSVAFCDTFTSIESEQQAKEELQ